MKVVFLSNYFNHHQKPFCDAMYARLGKDFTFIETVPMEDDRKKLGWNDNDNVDYVIRAHTDEETKRKCMDLVYDADFLITGSASLEYFSKRISDGKIVFRYSERILKKGFEPLKYPLRYLRFHKNNPSNKPIYMLCASAYASKDYSCFGMFKNKMFKWGYFPELKIHENLNQLIEKKETNSIIWVGRLIDWKHPEVAIEIAKRLKKDQISFKMTIIGTGNLDEKIKAMVNDNCLDNQVNIVGATTPQDVRDYMEKSEIQIITSDRNEGWGAVLNESMNSACAIVVNRDVGAAPYLIKDGENGFTYTNANIDELYEKVLKIIDNPDMRKKVSASAYQTILKHWNADIAAERLLTLFSEFSKGNNNTSIFSDGICSKA